MVSQRMGLIFSGNDGVWLLRLDNEDLWLPICALLGHSHQGESATTSWTADLGKGACGEKLRSPVNSQCWLASGWVCHLGMRPSSLCQALLSSCICWVIPLSKTTQLSPTEIPGLEQLCEINVKSEVAQSCLTLWDLMDCSLPHSPIHGIFQARLLEWVAISFSRGSSRPRDRTRVSLIVSRCFTVWATREVKWKLLMCPTLCDPMDCIVQWNSPGQNTGVGSVSLLQGIYLPNPGMEPRSPALQVDSLPAEPQGKPKNIGVGSLSLLQGILPIQESNRGLLHCRQILYQQS